MSKKNDLDAFLEEEGNAIEAGADAPITDATKVTRGHPKTRTLQVRLSPEEYEGLEKIADERGLPVSTVARENLQKLLASTSSSAAERVIAEFSRYVHSLDESQRLSADIVWAAGRPHPVADMPKSVPPPSVIAAVTKRLSELNLSAAEDMNRYVEQTINSPTFKLWRSEADLPAE